MAPTLRQPKNKKASKAKVTKKVSKKTTKSLTSQVKRHISLSPAVTGDITKLAPSDSKRKSLIVVPHLEPFSDLETIRKTVEKYDSSFALHTDASPLGGLGQIIKKHGKVTTAFFALAALASKEIYMIDPGTLNFVNTSIVMFSYYVVAQDSVKQAYRDFVDGINAKYQDGLKASVAVLEAGIRHCNATLDKPSVIKDANAAFQEAHDALTEARVRSSQQKHKDVTMNKLNMLYAQEQAEAKQQADQVRSVALNYLKQNAFTDKVKNDVMTEALSLVGKKTPDMAPPEFKSLQSVLKDALAHANKK